MSLYVIHSSCWNVKCIQIPLIGKATIPYRKAAPLLHQHNHNFDTSSVESVRGGTSGGGSYGGDEAELNLDIKHRGRDVKAVACGPKMSGRSAVLTPFPALPWESHACCNNVATDSIPLPPRLFTLNLLSSPKLTT